MIESEVKPKHHMENKYFKIRTNIYGDTVYYYHYVDGFAHRQLGVTRTEIYMMTDKSEIADGILSDSDFEPDDSITAEEFEKAWNSPLAVQKELIFSLQSNFDSEEKFICIEFVELGKETVSFYHFIEEKAVRIIEITKSSIYMMNDRSSLKIKLTGKLLSKTIDESSLKISDVSFSDVEVFPQFFITSEEFGDAWNSPLKMQKRLFGNSNSLLNGSNAKEKFVRISFEVFGKFTVGYYHFVGDYAVRIIEFTETEILMMNDKYSTKIKLTDNFLSKEVTDSSLKITDAPFSDVEILPESYITADEFETAWNSPKSEQKKLFGK